LEVGALLEVVADGWWPKGAATVATVGGTTVGQLLSLLCFSWA